MKKSLLIALILIIIIATVVIGVVLTGGESYELTINVEGEGKTHPPEGTYTYREGREVTITALPEEDQTLVEWTGDYRAREKRIVVVMDKDKSVIARFTLHVYPGANIITIPLGWEEDIRRDLPNSEIIFSSSDDSLEEIEEWYNSYFTDRGWENVFKDEDSWDTYLRAWRKEDIGLLVVKIFVDSWDAREFPGVEAESTVILIVKDDFDAIEKVLIDEMDYKRPDDNEEATGAAEDMAGDLAFD